MVGDRPTDRPTDREGGREGDKIIGLRDGISNSCRAREGAPARRWLGGWAGGTDMKEGRKAGTTSGPDRGTLIDRDFELEAIERGREGGRQDYWFT